MATKSPAAVVAFLEHVHGADADFGDRADVPAVVVVPRRARFREGDHVVIAPMHAVHESDNVAGAIRETKAENARIKIDGSGNVGGEQQRVRQSTGARSGRRAAIWRAALTAGRRHNAEARFFIRRGLCRDPGFHQISVLIVKPDIAGLKMLRRIDARDAEVLKPFGEGLKILLEQAEGKIAEFFPRTFADADPAMRRALGIKPKAVSLLANVKTERVIEGLRHFQVGHDHVTLIKGMNAEFARPSRWLNEAVVGGHVDSFFRLSRPSRSGWLSKRFARTPICHVRFNNSARWSLRLDMSCANDPGPLLGFRFQEFPEFRWRHRQGL